MKKLTPVQISVLERLAGGEKLWWIMGRYGFVGEKRLHDRTWQALIGFSEAVREPGYGWRLTINEAGRAALKLAKGE